MFWSISLASPSIRYFSSSRNFSKKINRSSTRTGGGHLHRRRYYNSWKNKGDHDINWKNFLVRCKSEGIKLDQEKTEKEKKTITFMGHKITEDGLEIHPTKVKAIDSFPVTTNTTQLKSFLGAIGFPSRFLPCRVLVIS